MNFLYQKISFAIAFIFLLSCCAWYIYILHGLSDKLANEELLTSDSYRMANSLKAELLK